MTTKRFNYFDDFKRLILDCPKCHWKGTFENPTCQQTHETASQLDG